MISVQVIKKGLIPLTTTSEPLERMANQRISEDGMQVKKLRKWELGIGSVLVEENHMAIVFFLICPWDLVIVSNVSLYYPFLIILRLGTKLILHHTDEFSQYGPIGRFTSLKDISEWDDLLHQSTSFMVNVIVISF